MSRLNASIKLSLIVGLCGGCVSVQSPSGWKYNSCAKDIAVHAKLPDGSEIDITSNVNSEALKAVAEGAARGAVSGARP